MARPETLTVRLSKEEKALIKNQSEKEGRSITRQVVWLFEQREKELSKNEGS